MNALFDEYLERLSTLHDGFKTAVHNLPPEALDWQPGPDMNTFNVIISHVAGSERFWIGDMVGQDPSGRVRAEEFQQKGLTAVTLIEKDERRFIITEWSDVPTDTIRLQDKDGNSWLLDTKSGETTAE